MNTKYLVVLSEEQRQQLEKITSSGKVPARQMKRAQILLNNPEFSRAYYNRRVIYYEQGKYDFAIADYDQAIQINPEYVVAYHACGLAYQALGKSAEAEADFLKYEELTRQNQP